MERGAGGVEKRGDYSCMNFWEKFKNRNQRLALTLISKNWLGFFIATALLVGGYITDQVWLIAFGIAVGVNVFQKAKGISDEKTIRPNQD